MHARQPLTPYVESYRFWDVVTLWARERLEHEQIVARALARAVIFDGLKLNSVEARWLPGDQRGPALNRRPYVGYRARPGAATCILRAVALQHLLGVVLRGKDLSRHVLHEEFLLRDDFRAWLLSQELQLPQFWFYTRLGMRATI
ncbi:MAG: hypothetical protein JNJ60_07440 [Rhodocyclaceae bacterium]|nr:hypothetical protein [Rhodocyclaceae bacterium]